MQIKENVYLEKQSFSAKLQHVVETEYGTLIWYNKNLISQSRYEKLQHFNSRFLPTILNLLRSETFRTEHTLLTQMKSMITSGYLKLYQVHCLKTDMKCAYRYQLSQILYSRILFLLPIYNSKLWNMHYSPKTNEMIASSFGHYFYFQNSFLTQKMARNEVKTCSHENSLQYPVWDKWYITSLQTSGSKFLLKIFRPCLP